MVGYQCHACQLIMAVQASRRDQAIGSAGGDRFSSAACSKIVRQWGRAARPKCSRVSSAMAKVQRAGAVVIMSLFRPNGHDRDNRIDGHRTAHIPVPPSVRAQCVYPCTIAGGRPDPPAHLSSFAERHGGYGCGRQSRRRPPRAFGDGLHMTRALLSRLRAAQATYCCRAGRENKAAG